jgi:hypothetical protein
MRRSHDASRPVLSGQALTRCAGGLHPLPRERAGCPCAGCSAAAETAGIEIAEGSVMLDQRGNTMAQSAIETTRKDVQP